MPKKLGNKVRAGPKFINPTPTAPDLRYIQWLTRLYMREHKRRPKNESELKAFEKEYRASWKKTRS